ncbi:XRE family transcriptional regulator [Coriobacteriales bacterium OH1046]|nr:XRE family transcriptional regulator [Coriobacteriales bacterium OH1046]
MGIMENIIKLRMLSNMTQEEFAKIADVSRAAVSLWEIGHSEPRMGAIQRLADYFGIRKANIIEDSGMEGATVGADGKIIAPMIPAGMSSFVDVPLYGSIAAGTPIEMESVEGFIAIPERMHNRYPDAFLLAVQGESMNRRLPNGSYALVNPASDVVDGRVYAVCVNGYDATIKRVRMLNNGVELVPDSTDPTFRPRVYDYGEEGTDTVTVIGEVVWCVFPYDYDF